MDDHFQCALGQQNCSAALLILEMGGPCDLAAVFGGIGFIINISSP